MKHTIRHPFSEVLFEYRSVEGKKLILALAITSAVMVVEGIGGYFTHSIALMSDAGHMLTHAIAIGLSLAAILIARKPPCEKRTFGLFRAEILAAFVNGLFLVLVVGAILYKAVIRIMSPREIHTLEMMVIALIGLGVNVASIFILGGSHKTDLNIRSVFYHIIADLASSVVIILAGFAIAYTGWHTIDPLVSVGISLLILFWAWGILKESTRVLLEMAPPGLDVDLINADLMERFPEITEIHSAHLWTISTDILVYTSHIRFSDHIPHQRHKELIGEAIRYLARTYRIAESTIQTACEEETAPCAVRRELSPG